MTWWCGNFFVYAVTRVFNTSIRVQTMENCRRFIKLQVITILSWLITSGYRTFSIEWRRPLIIDSVEKNDSKVFSLSRKPNFCIYMGKFRKPWIKTTSTTTITDSTTLHVHDIFAVVVVVLKPPPRWKWICVLSNSIAPIWTCSICQM